MNKYPYIFCVLFALYQGSVSAMAELPDPTKPADYFIAPEIIEVNELPDELVDWNLSAIRINDKNDDRSAIINGRLVRAGDEIGSARVLEIRSTSVMLDYKDRHVVVRLFSNIVDKKISTNSNSKQN